MYKYTHKQGSFVSTITRACTLRPEECLQHTPASHRASPLGVQCPRFQQYGPPAAAWPQHGRGQRRGRDVADADFETNVSKSARLTVCVYIYIHIYIYTYMYIHMYI